MDFRTPIAAAVAVTLACLPACVGTGDATRSDGTPVSSWFVDASSGSGLDFVHETGADGRFRMPEIMAAGVALFDADGDGDLDAYLTSGGTNRLFVQDEGGRFEDRTEASGLGDRGYGMGVAIGDVDDDGDADVYVTNDGPDRLYENRGDGTFEDVTERGRISVDGWSCSAVFFDYDLDGRLDLYVTRYVRHDPGKRCEDAAGRADYCAPQVFPPVADVLLRNAGDGTFEDVSARAGLHAAVGPGLGVVAEDFDDDGRPDVFVANDGAANHLWINAGDGTFREQALIQGVAYNIEGRAEAGMGAVAADLDGNGHIDLFLTHLSGETNTLYLNRGPGGGFDDATGTAALAPHGRAYTGFGAAALDLEQDGDLDLVVVNGRVTRGTPAPHASVPAPWDSFAEPNLLLVNRGAARFDVAAPGGGTLDGTVEVSRGLAVGDVDGDGDTDLLVSNVEGRARLYRNDAPRSGSWLAVRALTRRGGRAAIGARVTLVGDGPRQLRTIGRGGSYLSSSPPVARFAVGGTAQRIEVRWPGGAVESFAVPGPDRTLTVVRGEGTVGP